MKAAALLCCRNEEVHIGPALDTLIREGLDVVLIDHGSTDNTVPIARGYLGRGLLGIEGLPWEGVFSLATQLEAKRAVIDQLDHEWVVSADADEWVTSPDPGATLLEGLERADAAGANCVNFNEFVFVPAPGEDFEAPDYRMRMTRYYFFSPSRGRFRRAPKTRLPRAWKPGARLHTGADGHRMTGPARFYPRSFILRHYICLSESHARRKYVNRPFDDDEVARGWHLNRVGLTDASLRLREDRRIRELPHWSSKALEVSAPARRHYWQWPRDDR
jgi:glycosyltransferase involved in cell wall biosynthesis